MTTTTRRPAEVVLYEAELEPVRAGEGGLYVAIRGQAVPYGVWTNRGWFLESVAPGCFDKSIGEAAAGLPLLMFHDDASLPVGKSESWDPRKTGLWGEWSLDRRPEAQEAGRLADEGLLRWFSAGHSPIRSEWQRVDDWDPDLGPEYMDRLTRLESRLLETSLVTTPAFAGAQVEGVDRMRAKYERTAERPRDPTKVRPHLKAWQGWRATLDGGA